MSTFEPIQSGHYYSEPRDFDDHFDQDNQDAIRALVLGRRVTVASDDHLMLDDGTILRLVGNDGGCACSAGCYDLTALNGTDNVITAVEFEDNPGDDYSDTNGTYRIFVLAGDDRINLATFEGSDGTGYYGTGYHIYVRRPKVEVKP